MKCPSSKEQEIWKNKKEKNKKLREERKSPFSRFYQINKDNSDYLRSCLDENPKALKLLLFIFDHMDKYNAVICSYKVFQETLGMGQATVARCVKYLKDHGFFICLQNRYKQCLCCQ